MYIVFGRLLFGLVFNRTKSANKHEHTSSANRKSDNTNPKVSVENTNIVEFLEMLGRMPAIMIMFEQKTVFRSTP